MKDSDEAGGLRAGLRNTWAWYLARGRATKIVIALFALMVIVTAIPGEDVDQAGTTTTDADTSGEAAEAEPSAEAEAKEKAEAQAEAEAVAKAEAEAKAKETAESEAKRKVRAEAKRKAAAAKAARIAAMTYLVTRVIDGDTIELGNGESVRLLGIDTPERGECGFDTGTARMQRLVLNQRVRLTTADEDIDRYGRLLRYVDIGKRDAGLALINAGLAIARYDSRDGYGFHPRENRYIAADKATPDRTACTEPEPEPQPVQSGGGGSAYYENCTAARDAGAAPVSRGDPGYGSHLDRDGDGVACE